jgi:uncharacterized protein (DUF1015 family)
MAEVIPFKGILFDSGKINDLADVITPPFDVISKSAQQQFYERSPYNVVRLILGKKTEFDTRHQNPHSRAADYFNEWRENEILTKDCRPAFYLTAFEFPFDGRKMNRFGLISAVRLAAYSEGVILPHEKTFTNVKSERLQLMRASGTNFSPIFSLYPDDEGIIYNHLTTLAGAASPDIEFSDHDGCRHRVWRLTEKESVDWVSSVMADKRIYIADGHHRYETALSYRDWLRGQKKNLDPDHPANYVMMYLCSMKDPGLVIRPAHRLLKDIPKTAAEDMISKVGDFFKVESIPFDENERDKVQSQFSSLLTPENSENVIGVFVRGRREYFVLRLDRPQVMTEMFGNELSEVLLNLDVTVLTRLIFMEILGFDQARLDNEKLIGYTTDIKDAVNKVVKGDFDAAFILNPTAVEQVRDIADHHLVMPRKATYFFPKVTTGLVMKSVES